MNSYPCIKCGNRDYFVESVCVQDSHSRWWSIWNQTSENSEQVRFLILHQRVSKSGTKHFLCCNLFILYILRFSHPQKYILALDKFELQTTQVHRKYYFVKAARQTYLRWLRKSPQKHNLLKLWFVIGWSNFFTCEKLVLPLWMVEVKSVRLCHSKIWCENRSICKINQVRQHQQTSQCNDCGFWQHRIRRRLFGSK